MERQRENIMGTMPKGRLLFKLALPMILSVLVSSLYNIVDSIFVGRIGPYALTAISLGAPASSLIQFKASAFLPDLKMIKEILIVAIPTTLTYSINSVLMFGMNQVLVGLSLAAPAVYIIYMPVILRRAIPRSSRRPSPR